MSARSFVRPKLMIRTPWGNLWHCQHGYGHNHAYYFTALLCELTAWAIGWPRRPR
jgi:hypothetical protein